ncbi:putative orfan [Tupanvirus soda lake]|uniref:Orfan n=2 Tax=Tupanvirus TaxID=2094720 RepID=A0AC62AA89_9VIRU|nr:putative orfan [Tupanvirus soda lake]QKU34661.1 putative orfan [Tupanvirus soda lake]
MSFMYDYNNDYFRNGGAYGYGYVYGYGNGYGTYHDGFVQSCNRPCYYGGFACNPLGSYGGPDYYRRWLW